jgi:hypothetical protein
MSLLTVIALVLTLFTSCATNQGTPAPAFALSDMTGRQFSLVDYKGQKAVLLLFANCNNGGIQDPLVQGYISRYQNASGLVTLCVANGAAIPADVRQYMAGQIGGCQAGSVDASGTLPMMDADGSVGKAFGASPDKLSLVLVDRSGYIRFREEITSAAETDTELAKQIEDVTK